MLESKAPCCPQQPTRPHAAPEVPPSPRARDCPGPRREPSSDVEERLRWRSGARPASPPSHLTNLVPRLAPGACGERARGGEASGLDGDQDGEARAAHQRGARLRRDHRGAPRTSRPRAPGTEGCRLPAHCDCLRTACCMRTATVVAASGTHGDGRCRTRRWPTSPSSKA